ncbi:putative Myosin-1 [Glarea lozoyensis 74030]|uniref:Myosin-1 n=1 Tax=Glarea lozoyensis (strain ATCC 74030 / MF5533) TaxID=1104152 RepID=H0EH42_GLAL7|nr:putative Myosin-1 [Glarea lozoyensis 74030]
MAITRRRDKTAKAQDGGKGAASGGKPNIKKAAFDTTKKKEIGVSDLTLISKVTPEAINDNLKKRFEAGEIYVRMPFGRRDVLDGYKGKNRLEMPPHVFAVAESAYYNMNAYKENQCVIISGESGAGKTEAAKRLMQYIASVSGEYQDTLNAMKTIGLTQPEQDEIFRMLAAVLWIGNIQFQEDKDGYAQVTDQSVVDFVAYLLEVDPQEVIKAITIRILTPRSGEIIESLANPSQALATRDGLAKAIYNSLFDWIVERINRSLKARGTTAHSIGILDIYGFEIFEKNSFEQLCINYVNEKLQQIFIQLTLKAEQEEYAREQIQWTPIKYFDNKIVCDLIESVRPPGVFSVMKDATKTANADPAACDRTFMTAINSMSNPHLTPRQGNFIIKHYAGDVSYSVDGITDKNKDQLLKGILNLFGRSSNKFVHDLFPHEVDQDNRKQPPSAGDKIKTSANELVSTLMKAQPSYIRTIKPNENKSWSEYNVPNVMHQIKYLGLQENVRIRRAGFAYRQTFDKFVERFYLLSPQTSYAGDYTWTGDSKSGAKQILKDTSIPAEEFQMGVTKAFIKAPETLFALEHMRDRYWHNMAIRIQRVWRAFLRIRIEAATRIQRVWRKKRIGAEFLLLRERGHKVLQGRKERRRFSLLGSRRFMGDYLGVNASAGQGSRIRNAANLPSNEQAIFSCRGELLETKFGRSSKLSPRILVLTRAKFYIIAQHLVNKQVQVAIERAVPLGAIKFVSVSTCRDDWFSLGISSPQEADPLLTCVLKTELFTHMQSVMPGGGFTLKISDAIEYAKKPNKMQLVKVIKDSTMREDFYKSGAVHTTQGEPPNSVSRPLPKGKPIPAKPFTKGRLIKPGGPGGRPSKHTNTTRNTKPVAQPTQSYGTPSVARNVPPAPQPAQSYGTPAAGRSVPQAATANIPMHTRNTSSVSSGRSVPPPPPPAPPATAKAAPTQPQYKVLYEFAGQSENEITIRPGDMVTVQKKETNGEGWAPSAYLEEVAPPPPPPTIRPTPPPPPPPAAKTNGANGVRGKPTPPAPPAKRPAAGRKPAPPPAPRDSGMSLNASGTDSGRSTPTPSLAGGLAEALRARQSAMQKGKDDDDDW